MYLLKKLILRTLKIQQGQNDLKKLRSIISKKGIWKKWCKDYDYNSEIEPCKDKVATKAEEERQVLMPSKIRDTHSFCVGHSF